MNATISFLPGFDASHLENYFSNDAEAIKGMFLLVNEGLESDLHKVSNAYKEEKIAELQESVHTIRPLFFMLGLPEIQKVLNEFFDLCMSASSVKEVSGAYTELWPKLEDAKSLINEQCKFFLLQTNIRA